MRVDFEEATQILEEEIARLRDLLHRVDELIHNGAPVSDYWSLIQDELENEAGVTKSVQTEDAEK